MFRRIAVGDIMTRNFISLAPEAHLLECAKQMVRNKINSLILAKNKRLVGIITQRDILWAITKKPKLDLKSIKAIDIATRKVAVIKPSATITEAFEKMKHYGFRRLPVLVKGQVIGLLTLKDILRVDPSFYTKAEDFLDVREEQRKTRVRSEELEAEGLCDECGALSDLLKVESRMLCPDCRNELY